MVVEGGNLEFDVTLSDPVDVDTVITYSTADDSATTADSDYTAQTGQTLTIDAGQTSGTIVVATTTDSKVELNEFLDLNITAVEAGGRDVGLFVPGSPPAVASFKFSTTQDRTLQGNLVIEEQVWTFEGSNAPGTEVVGPFFAPAFQDADEDVDAISVRDDTVFFSTAGAATIIDGATSLAVDGNDVIAFDSTQPAGSRYTVFFNPDTLWDGNSDTDAISFHGDGDLLLSTTATVADGTFVATLDDVVKINLTTLTPSLFFDGSNFSTTANIDAFAFYSATEMYLSISSDGEELPAIGGGTLAFSDADIVLWDGSGAQIAVSSLAFGNASPAGDFDLDAIGVTSAVQDSTAKGTILNDDSAVISINAPSETEGTALGFTVTINNPVDLAVTADRETQDDTATTADSDYTAIASGNVQLFAAGSTTALTITVNTTADNTVEADEALDLLLSTLSAGGRDVTFNGGGATLTGTGTIENDDAAEFTVSSESGNEDGGPITFTVTLSNPVDVVTSVDVSTDDGTALLSDSDYTQVSGLTLNFAAGVTSQTFEVTPTADNRVELDETFSVSLSNAASGGTGAPAIVGFGGTVFDSDVNVLHSNLGIDPDDYVFESFEDLALIPELTMTSSGSSVGVSGGAPGTNAWEGPTYLIMDNGPGTLTWTVSGGTSSFGFGIANDDFDVHTFQINGGSPIAFSDIPNYLLLGQIPAAVRWRNGYVFINQQAGGDPINTITINHNSSTDGLTFDYVAIGNFSVPASAARNLTASTSSGTGTILNDDSAVISINGPSETESTALGFTVTINNPVDVALTADRETQDDTATTADNDYTAIAAGNVQLFAAGSTTALSIPVSTTDDSKVEFDETLKLVLSTLSAGGRNVTFNGGGATLTGTGTILDNDVALVSITNANDASETGTVSVSSPSRRVQSVPPIRLSVTRCWLPARPPAAQTIRRSAALSRSWPATLRRTSMSQESLMMAPWKPMRQSSCS